MSNRAVAFLAFLSLSVAAFGQTTPTAVLTAAKPLQGAALGYYVAMSGSTVATTAMTRVFGKIVNAGFVYTKPASAAWSDMTQSALLVPPDDNLVGPIAINGDGSIIVATSVQKGVYVFVRPAGGWQGVVNRTARLTFGPAPKPWVNQGNAQYIAINATGDTIVTGALDAGYLEHRSGGVDVPASPNRGAVYVFTKPAGGWADMTATAKLTASDAAANAYFGGPVAISANTVLVGAGGVSDYEGAAYLFNRPASGTWTTTQRFQSKFTIPGEQFQDELGSSLVIGNSGALVVLGDLQGCNYSTDPNNVGHAFVYVKPTHGWPASPSPTATLTPSDLTTAGCFAPIAVGESDGKQYVLAGASGTWTTSTYGAAYTFAEPATGWADMSLPASMFGDSNAIFFGVSGSFGGRTIAVGASDNLVDDQYEGAIFLFRN
jgi:hypothetical protein